MMLIIFTAAVVALFVWVMYSIYVNKTPEYSVEYYPLTNRYYPKYRHYYLGTHWNTGIVELKEAYLFGYADYSETEKGAEEILEKFKEQQLKVNIKTIIK